MSRRKMAAVLVALALAVPASGCEDDPHTVQDACEGFYRACPSEAARLMSSYGSEYFSAGWIAGCPGYVNRFYVYGGVDCLASAGTCADVALCDAQYYMC